MSHWHPDKTVVVDGHRMPEHRYAVLVAYWSISRKGNPATTRQIADAVPSTNTTYARMALLELQKIGLITGIGMPTKREAPGLYHRLDMARQRAKYWSGLFGHRFDREQYDAAMRAVNRIADQLYKETGRRPAVQDLVRMAARKRGE